ncbi:U2 small nuclear ribonucleoprotein A'-like [Actinia tenebrosa]|uniref:U2 small nuclear ribonucleoprotein A'-like n=1 Tax=Actinia tenebrosa TaxID=6105 RepID=A0A6P8HUC4_ACTTE|nr:U2 small nuclear ribonucleoprotein A'-like [Actinia tenebrosa]
MKITADLILQCAQYTNAVKDRELDLRGYKISVIENMGATLDQFDTIDMSDNDIRKIEGFALLKRLKTLLFNSNRICRIAEGLEESLPNLESLILTSNAMQDLKDLEPLKSIKTLKYLSLLRNPVTNKPYYRLFVIHNIPQLRVLDFQRIKMREREAAKRMFSGKKGQAVTSKKPKTFTPGEPLKKKEKRPEAPPSRDVTAIKAAIANAKSLDEVQRLEMMLKSGQIPGADAKPADDQEEMEVINGTT